MMPPVFFVWEVTSRCNLDCPFCYNVWKHGVLRDHSELASDDIGVVAEAIAKARPASVTLTGGEPLLRDDLEWIASLLRDRGIMVGVATNGRLLDRQRADSLRNAGVDWFEVSILSVLPGKHRTLSGEDRFSSSKRAMTAVKDSGARLTVSHVVTSANFDETGRIADLALAFGAEALALNRLVPPRDGRDMRKLVPSAEQLDSALRSASEKLRASSGMTVYAAIPVENCILPHDRYPGVKFGSCVCGLKKWAVGPSGCLRVCEQSRCMLGSLLENSFEELSDSASVRDFRRRAPFAECGSCGAFEECGGGCRFLYQ